MDWETINEFRAEATSAALQIQALLPQLQFNKPDPQSDVGQKLIPLIQVLQINSSMIRNENVREIARKLQQVFESLIQKQRTITPETLERLNQAVRLTLELLERMTPEEPNPPHKQFEIAMGRFRAEGSEDRDLSNLRPPLPSIPNPQPAPPSPPPIPSSTGTGPDGEIPADLDLSLLEDYLEEGHELLNQLEQQLTQLERYPNERTLLNSIFRIVHSFKGDSYAIGLRQTGDLAHRMETVFDRIRTGNLRITPPLMDALLACLDGLRSNLGFLSQRRFVERGLSHLAERLDRAGLTGVALEATSATPSEKAPSPPLSLKEIVDEGDKEIMQEMIPQMGEEVLELLKEFEDCLLGFDQGEITPEGINRAFRAIHNLKGIIGYYGSREIVDLAQSTESLLAKVRSSEIQMTGELCDLMLHSVDLLRKLNRPALAGEPSEALSSESARMIDQIEKALGIQAKKGKEPGEISEEGKGVGATAPVQTLPEAPLPESPPTISGPFQASLADTTGSVATFRSLRVDVDKLDRVMNLMGEVVINKSRLDQQVSDALRLLERMSIRRTLFEKPRPGVGRRHFQSRQRLPGMLSLTVEREEELPIEELRDDMGRTNEVLRRVVGELQEGLMSLRMVPINTIFIKFPRLVRDLCRKMNKDVRLEIHGEETELDKNIVEEISDPLLHLVRNAVDHGIESAEERVKVGKPEAGRIFLSAHHEGDHIIIEIKDDGRGMDPENLKELAVRKGLITKEQADNLDRFAALNLIFLPGFSSKEQATDVSGRGVGMDIVKFNVARLNGTIDIDTEVGRGTCFTLKLPLTMAIITALLVRVAGQTYALPLSSVKEALEVAEADIKGVGSREVIDLRNRILPVVRLASVLGLRQDRSDPGGHPYPIIVAGSAESRIGLRVDKIHGKQEIVIKSLGDILLKVKHLSGGTILGDGRVVPILNVQSIIDSVTHGEGRRGEKMEGPGLPTRSTPGP